MANNATELVIHKGGDAIPAPVIDYSREQIELIKDIYAKGATDSELRLFLEIAKRKGLDIFSNQLYLIERWDAALGKTVKRPQTSIDGFRLIADRTGNYAPGRKAEFSHDGNGRVISATAFVQKRVGGEWFEVSAEVWFEEYKQTKKDGTITAMWSKMPHVMLSKCAEAVTLRRAFPADLSGLYTSDEMGTAETGQAAEPAPAIEKNITPAAIAEGANKIAKAAVIAATVETPAQTPAGLLAALIRELRQYGIANAEIQAHMKNLTGVEKRAELNPAQVEVCIDQFAAWTNELHAKLAETGGE